MDSSSFVAEQELIDALEKRSSVFQCSEERTLFEQGESSTGLYLLRKGRATLRMESATGSPIMSVIATPGALLGLPAVVGNEPYTLTAIAAKGAELGFVTREDFSALMLADPMVAMRVLKVLAAEVRTARHAISEY